MRSVDQLMAEVAIHMNHLDARDPAYVSSIIEGIMMACKENDDPLERLLVQIYRAGMADALSYLILRTPEKLDTASRN